MNDPPKDIEARITRASATAASRRKVTSRVVESFKKQFGAETRLHEFEMITGADFEFLAYIFFERDLDVDLAKASGLAASMEQFLFDELSREGNEPGREMKLSFEYGSYEEVVRDCNGHYFLRLR